jgi:hypothetical protein
MLLDIYLPLLRNVTVGMAMKFPKFEYRIQETVPPFPPLNRPTELSLPSH